MFTRCFKFLFALGFSMFWLYGVVELHMEMRKIANYASDEYAVVNAKVLSLKQHNFLPDYEKETGKHASRIYTFEIIYQYEGKLYTIKNSPPKYESMDDIFHAYRFSKFNGSDFFIPVYVNKNNPEEVGLFCANSAQTWWLYISAIVIEIIVISMAFYNGYCIIKKFKKY